MPESPLDCHGEPKCNSRLAMPCKNIRMAAFTLAEALITLLVIGIAAVLVLPQLQTEINSRVLDSQKKAFTTKLDNGLSMMQSNGELAENYSTTADFIKIMEKYFKIVKSCTAENLNECFVPTIMASQSSIKYNTANLRTSADIEASFSAESDLGGVVFSDGTSAIIAHKPSCIISDIYDKTISKTRCFAMIYDINGNTKPNVMGEDIQTINIGATTELDFEIGEVVKGKAMSIEECQNAIKEGAPTYSCNNATDYWAGTVYECWKIAPKGTWHLATISEYETIAKKVYDISSVSTKSETLYGGEPKDMDIWSKLAPYTGKGFFFSPIIDGTYSTCPRFNSNGYYPSSSWGICGKAVANSYGLCVKNK